MVALVGPSQVAAVPAQAVDRRLAGSYGDAMATAKSLLEVLAVHVPSPRFPRQCVCGGRYGRCLAVTLARQEDDEKALRPARED